ncbi:hypothetical protein LguiA_020233 [Lonicera macranthoides]
MPPTVVVVVVTDSGEQTPHLHHNSSPPADSTGNSLSTSQSQSSNEQDPNSAGTKQTSFVVSKSPQLMILFDDAGGAFPSINHSPWFGVTLADFVMPFSYLVLVFQ